MILLNHNIKDLQGFNVSTKELLNAFKGLRLGQILRGKVLDILDSGEILALINGEKFKVSSNLNLVEGDVLFLKVLSMKPNVVLQLYGIETEKSGDPVSNILRMFKLDDGGLNRKVVSSMINNNVSIDKKEIQKLSETLSSILNNLIESESIKESDPEINRLINMIKSSNIPVTEEKIIDAMILLQSKNVPVTLKTTLIAFANMNDDTKITAAIKELFDILKTSKYNTEIQDIDIFSSIPADQDIPVEQIIKKLGLDYEKRIGEYTIPELKLKLNDEEVKQLAKEIISNLKIFENMDDSIKLKTLALKISGNDYEPSDVVNIFNIIKKIKPDFVFNKTHLIESLSKEDSVVIDNSIKRNNTGNVQDKQEQIISKKEKIIPDITLKQIALEIVNGSKVYEGLENSDKLKVLAQKILNNIEFQQLLSSDDTGDIKNWFFQFPVIKENERTNVELKISGKNRKSSKLNKVPFNFNLAVDMSALGKVRSHGSFYQNNLSLSFYLEDSKKIDAFKEDIDFLKKRFKELGIMLQNANVDSLSTENLVDMNKLFSEPSVSINVRA